jgi:CubicO group peptidase (beta-lactamase class C family)
MTIARLRTFAAIVFAVAFFFQPVLCLSVFAQDSQLDSNSVSIAEMLDSLECELDEVMNEGLIPGAAVAIVSADSVLVVWSSGYADPASQESVSSQTHFAVGSCTKTFSAL